MARLAAVGGAAGVANQRKTAVTIPPMARLVAAGGVAGVANRRKIAVTIPPMARLVAAGGTAGEKNNLVSIPFLTCPRSAPNWIWQGRGGFASERKKKLV